MKAFRKYIYQSSADFTRAMRWEAKYIFRDKAVFFSFVIVAIAVSFIYTYLYSSISISIFISIYLSLYLFIFLSIYFIFIYLSLSSIFTYISTYIHIDFSPIIYKYIKEEKKSPL